MSETERYHSCGTKISRIGKLHNYCKTRQYFVFLTHLVQACLDRLCGFSDHMTGSMSNSQHSRNVFIHTYKPCIVIFITHVLTIIVIVWSWFQTVVNSQTGWLEWKRIMSQEEFEEQLESTFSLLPNHSKYWTGSISDNTLYRGWNTRWESHYLQILCGPDMLLVNKTEDSPLSLATGEVASKNQ